MLISRRQSAVAVVEAYIRAREPWRLPLSTAAVVAHLRETLPDCEHADDELIQLIAICAVRQRCPLAFDGPFATVKAGASLEIADQSSET